MAGRGLLGRLGGWLAGRKKDPLTEAAAEQIDRQTGRQENPSGPAATEAPPQKSQLELLHEAVERHTGLIETALGELKRLSSAQEGLIQAVRSATGPDAPAGKSIAEVLERNEQLASELHELLTVSERQYELLQRMQVGMEAMREGELKAAATSGRVAEALDNLSRSNASQVELMEQVRDRLAGGDEELGDLIARQGRRMGQLLWVILAGLAVLVMVSIWGALS